MIEVRYNGPMLDAHPKHFAEDDIDEIVATDASVHLEVLGDNAIMLIVEDKERTIHTTISHAGRVPIRVQLDEEYRRGGEGSMTSKPVAPQLKARFNAWLDRRTAKGIETYGEPLKTHNRRNARRDMFEKLLDFCQYQQQHIMEMEDRLAESCACLKAARMIQENAQ